MISNNVHLNDSEAFDGIVEKIYVENDVKSATIWIKQWHLDTYALSELRFTGIIFQSLPDISSFNLINEIKTNHGTSAVLNNLNEYLDNNPGLMLGNTKDNINDDVKKHTDAKSFFFQSPYCTDWFIVCTEFFLTEEIK